MNLHFLTVSQHMLIHAQCYCLGKVAEMYKRGG